MAAQGREPVKVPVLPLTSTFPSVSAEWPLSG